MIAVETTIEPPVLHSPPVQDPPEVDVSIWITEPDGTRRMASMTVLDPTDGELADTLLACVRGVATLRGPGLVAALLDRRTR